ncbi:hypothetical protein RJ639_002314 [Escallonia herrerae]|uniref:Uncharacterized protein n=1 Tax=Escallonia herrerae TaxID=1293975 RepID=A0AA88XDU3_9ASTE|nr:hypothetical protein RJ639_002314 [Escallonia herrerae]
MATTTCDLLGPPGLHYSTIGTTLHGGATSEIQDVTSITTNITLSPKPQMGLTENLSPTFLSSGNPCLDFFFHVVPDTPPDDLIQRLQSAWDHDPLTTLKLICNLRGVRGTGKSDKEGFYTAAFWLHTHHPNTLALNLKAFADFGYFKDFLEILYRVLEGLDVRKREKIERFKNCARKGLSNLDEKKQEQEKEKARVLRKEREINKAKKALDKYNNDANYRCLHNKISDLFAELLKLDVENMILGSLSKISLAGKWCPTVDSSYDKATLICESVARKVFPRDVCKEYEGIDEGHYAYRVRERLRKEVLVPLHKALELPEVFMSANEWDALTYNRVASVAMKNYKELFLKHSPERFKEYLEDVRKEKAKIAAGALLPHEIIKELKKEESREVAELQWKRMVDDLAKKGKLSNCIAICDVSGSMDGVPMEVSVALGVLISELSEEPWKGKLITFSADPELQKLEGDTLLAKTEFVRKMDWGMNTDFQKVFDHILEIAVEGELREDQMIKRVFVFSDMEFDEASQNPWETDYQAIQRKFGEKGYKCVPEIVFWNLRHSSSTPVVASQSGVALVSGFSKNLLTIFLEGGGVMNPEDVMAMAIAGEEYKKLVVYD